MKNWPDIQEVLEENSTKKNIPLEIFAKNAYNKFEGTISKLDGNIEKFPELKPEDSFLIAYAIFQKLKEKKHDTELSQFICETCTQKNCLDFYECIAYFIQQDNSLSNSEIEKFTNDLRHSTISWDEASIDLLIQYVNAFDYQLSSSSDFETIYEAFLTDNNEKYVGDLLFDLCIIALCKKNASSLDCSAEQLYQHLSCQKDIAKLFDGEKSACEIELEFKESVGKSKPKKTVEIIEEKLISLETKKFENTLQEKKELIANLTEEQKKSLSTISTIAYRILSTPNFEHFNPGMFKFYFGKEESEFLEFAEKNEYFIKIVSSEKKHIAFNSPSYLTLFGGIYIANVIAGNQKPLGHNSQEEDIQNAFNFLKKNKYHPFSRNTSGKDIFEIVVLQLFKEKKYTDIEKIFDILCETDLIDETNLKNPTVPFEKHIALIVACLGACNIEISHEKSITEQLSKETECLTEKHKAHITLVDTATSQAKEKNYKPWTVYRMLNSVDQFSANIHEHITLLGTPLLKMTKPGIGDSIRKKDRQENAEKSINHLLLLLKNETNLDLLSQKKILQLLSPLFTINIDENLKKLNEYCIQKITENGLKDSHYALIKRFIARNVFPNKEPHKTPHKKSTKSRKNSSESHNSTSHSRKESHEEITHFLGGDSDQENDTIKILPETTPLLKKTTPTTKVRQETQEQEPNILLTSINQIHQKVSQGCAVLSGIILFYPVVLPLNVLVTLMLPRLSAESKNSLSEWTWIKMLQDIKKEYPIQPKENNMLSCDNIETMKAFLANLRKEFKIDIQTPLTKIHRGKPNEVCVLQLEAEEYKKVYAILKHKDTLSAIETAIRSYQQAPQSSCFNFWSSKLREHERQSNITILNEFKQTLLTEGHFCTAKECMDSMSASTSEIKKVIRSDNLQSLPKEALKTRRSLFEL
jgi:hypothetical protein